MNQHTKPASANDLWSLLSQAGLVQGEAPQGDAAQAHTPWFVRAMLGIAGWIGALFLLVFVASGLYFIIKSATASFLVGITACALSAWLMRVRTGGDFATQFGLALSLAGQGLVLFALGTGLEPSPRNFALYMALFQALLFFTHANVIHRVWCALTCAAGLYLAMAGSAWMPYASGLLSLACAWIWLNELRLAKHGELFRPGGFGLALALMLISGILPFFGGGWIWRTMQGAGEVDPTQWVVHYWLGAAFNGAVLLWTVSRLLAREDIRTASVPGLRALFGTLLIALAALKTPGLDAAVLILLLGFANGNRVVAGLGVLALLSCLSAFYYSLASTLMQKSALMAATGLALLALRQLQRSWWPTAGIGGRPPHEGAGHA